MTFESAFEDETFDSANAMSRNVHVIGCCTI